MVQVRAFRGLRFVPEAGNPASLIGPDDGGANHIARALPGASEDGDRSKYVRYARSAAQLAQWRRAGVLAPDAAPSLYRLTFPSGAAIVGLVRAALLASPAARAPEETLRLLEATRTYLELPVAVAEGLPVSGGGEYGVEAIGGGIEIPSARLVSGLAIVQGALAFRGSLGEREGEVAEDDIAEDWVPVALVSAPMEVPAGLVMWSLQEGV